jgi:hypothetical protein
MRCFLIQVQLSTLAQETARFPRLAPWVVRLVDLRSPLIRWSESTTSLYLCARDTSCACGLLDDSAKFDTRKWQLRKQAGAALANVAYLLGTGTSPAGFRVVPICVNHLYRATYPLPVQIIHLFEFVDSLIAGFLSNEVRYWVRTDLVKVGG